MALQKAIARENSENDAHHMNVNAVKFNRTLFSKTFQNQPSSGLNGNNSKTNFNRPQNQSTFNANVKCSKCTMRGHQANDRKVKCRFCRKTGHIKANCSKLKNKKVNNIQLNGDGDGNDNGDGNVFVDGNLYGEESGGDVLGDDVVQPFDYTFHITVGNNDSSFVECGNPKLRRDICIENDNLNYMSNCISDCNDNSLNSSFECTVSNENEIVNSVDLFEGQNFNVDDNLAEFQLPINYNVNEVDLVNKIQSNSSSKCMIKVLLNSKHVDMELDTGSEISCMSKKNFDKLGLVGSTLVKCPRQLIVANGQTVPVVYKTLVFVRYRDIQCKLVLRVVESEFPTLLGRDWMNILFGKNWFQRLIEVNQVKSVEQVKSEIVAKVKQSPVFQPGVGKVDKYTTSLDLKQGYRPKFCKARAVAYAEKERVGKELDRLEEAGYIERVDHSDWASPIVVVNKTDGGIRLCGDYKRTLNPNLDMKVYPLPSVEDCFVEMRGGTLFSKIDIKQAYNSLPLNDNDQILTTINTHQGLYKFKVLPFGVNSASAIFQSTIDKVLKGIPRVTCRVDDILITGLTIEEHISNLIEVIRRLEESGFKCRLDKSVFFALKVLYLGYELSKEGVRPCRSKVETLAKAAYPQNLEQLISFLGAAQYYSRFIGDMATLIEPLNRLRTSEWKFGPQEKKSFDTLKEKLTSNAVLVFYDPKLPLRIDCDASSYGLGAVLSHVDANGVDRPIEFISRTLSATERRYSQIDREALSIVWSIKRFHKYVYARPFELLTDHEPLQHIYNPDKGIPEMGSSRVVRWAIALSPYQFTVKYRPTKKHGNADVLSRFPLAEIEDECSIELEDMKSNEVATVFSLYMAEGKPLLNSEPMSQFTRKDLCLAKISYYVREGWPSSETPSEVSEFKAFHLRKCELTLEDGCLLWGNRVIVPEKLRPDILKMLHSTHMGMSSMKSLARNYVWWPKMDADIEFLVKQCQVCQANQRMPAKSLPHPWVRSQNPWERIHVDYAGPFKGNMWFIIVDSFSKWIEVFNMRNNIGATNTIHKLVILFSRFGLPKILVSDNARQLVKSHEFQQFCLSNGITHIPIPSYHPSSNGQAEIIVGKFKYAMKKMCEDNSNIEMNLSKWLLSYYNTPHSATGTEPSVLMLGRRLRSHLSLINPLSAGEKVKARIKETEARVESEKTLRRLVIGDPVLYRDVLGNAWKQGVIEKVSDKIYEIKASSGQVIRKHIDHVVKYQVGSASQEPKIESAQNSLNEKPRESNFKQVDSDIQQPSDTKRVPDVQIEMPIAQSTNSSLDNRPRRTTTKPDRLEYSKLGG